MKKSRFQSVSWITFMGISTIIISLFPLIALINEHLKFKNEVELPDDNARVFFEENFQNNKLWPKLLEITNSDPKLKKPKITIKIDEADKSIALMGCYFSYDKHIELYLRSTSIQYRFYAATNNQRSSWNGKKVLILNNIAHEELHYLYYKNFVPHKLHHRMMVVDMPKISEFIIKEYNADTALQRKFYMSLCQQTYEELKESSQ